MSQITPCACEFITQLRETIEKRDCRIADLETQITDLMEVNKQHQKSRAKFNEELTKVYRQNAALLDEMKALREENAKLAPKDDKKPGLLGWLPKM